MSHHHTQPASAVPEGLRDILDRYEHGHREYLIPLLQDVQERYEYLSQENIEAVAHHLGLPASKVFGVATFYNQFRLNAPGKYRISVCRGTACHVIGSAAILEALENELEIKAGETTRDGLFSLEVVACIGACSMAPVIMVNGEFYGRLTTKSIPKIVKDLRRKNQDEEGTGARCGMGGA